MAIQYSVAVRNARAQAVETVIGTSPLLRLYTGSVPANCAASATGTLLAELELPENWQADPSAGTAAKAGTWAGEGEANGSIGYYRIYDSAGTTCHEQAPVSLTEGSGDLKLDNIVIAIAQAIAIATWTKTEGNA